MTLPTYHVPSDAAKAFARSIDHDHDDIADYVRWTECSHAAAFDAGFTAALRTAFAEPSPEPIRLTDPDDPRIRVGALVQSDSHDSIGGYSTVIYRYLLDDKPTAGGFTCGTVAYVREQIAGGSKNYSLLAEAPDPEDPRVEVLAEALHDRGGCDDEWPKCSPSTLEHYRHAARSLLPVLDAARADA